MPTRCYCSASPGRSDRSSSTLCIRGTTSDQRSQSTTLEQGAQELHRSPCRLLDQLECRDHKDFSRSRRWRAAAGLRALRRSPTMITFDCLIKFWCGLRPLTRLHPHPGPDGPNPRGPVGPSLIAPAHDCPCHGRVPTGRTSAAKDGPGFPTRPGVFIDLVSRLLILVDNPGGRCG